MLRRIKWEKSIIIDKEFIEEIENIYKIINNEPIFLLETKSQAQYEFNTKEELLKYKFDEKIHSLQIKTKIEDDKNDMFFCFKVNEGLFFNYDYIAECMYEIENNDLDSIIKEKVLNLYRNNTKSDWFIGKIGLKSIIMITLLILLVVYSLIDIIQNNNIFIYDIRFPIFTIFFSLSIPLVYFISIADEKICDKFFTPIVYLFGFQKRKWEENLKIRTNIFWTIIISFIVGIGTTFFYNSFIG